MMNTRQKVDTDRDNYYFVEMAKNKQFVKNKAGVSSSPVDSLNAAFLLTIISAQRKGLGCLPHYLGLEKTAFAQLFEDLLPSYKAVLPDVDPNNPYEKLIADRSDMRQQLLDMRADEVAELSALLVEYRAGVEDTELWMADIVTAACMGSDHLWRDLGLPDRKVLNQLLRYNFPALVVENTGDMKWKKFLYRKLCETGGDYVCRSPTCEQCVSYAECFGSEEH